MRVVVGSLGIDGEADAWFRSIPAYANDLSRARTYRCHARDAKGICNVS